LKYSKFIFFNCEEIKHAQISFSQFGEDLVVYNLLKNKINNKGIYIDVGAFHPVIISTTHLLYKLGWRGINIDMDKYKIDGFRRYRKGDEFVTAAVSNEEKEMLQISYGKDNVLNRIVELDNKLLESEYNDKPTDINECYTTTLNSIIEKSKFKDKDIDYLNIDCEGSDYNILSGLNFIKYKPFIISIEQKQNSGLIDNILIKHGYLKETERGVTAIYRKI
jgi:hypothetical protein